MRSGLLSVRAAWGAMFALLLAIHSLAPAGFMPAFNHGAVSIVACPDAGTVSAPMPMNGAEHQKSAHQQCPYAAVSSLTAIGTDGTPLLGNPHFPVALLLRRTFLVAENYAKRDRPPVRAPPIPV